MDLERSEIQSLDGEYRKVARTATDQRLFEAVRRAYPREHMSVLTDVLEFFTAASAPSNATSSDATRKKEVTTLFACTECNRTYIQSATSALQSCPQCDGPVERTPSFAELGIDPHPERRS